MLLLLLVPLLINAQVNIQPLIELLRPESMQRMASIATELSSMAAANIRNNEKQVKEAQEERDAEIPIEQDARPSRILGGVMSDMSNQGRGAFLRALAPLADLSASTAAPLLQPPSTQAIVVETPIVPVQSVPERPPSPGLNIQKLETQSDHIEIITPSPRVNAAPTVHVASPQLSSVDVAPVSEVRLNPSNPLGAPVDSSVSVQAQKGPNALIRIAEAFLGGGRQGGTADGTANAAKEVMSLGIRDFMPGADSNFGIPKGKGCLPFLSEFMQAAYGNCQQIADERAFDAWGSELRSAILTGQIDILKASQETCRRGAERQQCASLRKAIADCDIMKSLTVGGQLQRAMQRCEDVGGLMDQDPILVLGQLNRLIGGEMAQGFFNNFLTGKPA